MWIMTTVGFFSITESPVEEGKLQIRARERKDLDNLGRIYGVPGEIIETPTADYRWRLVVEPAVVQELMKALVENIGYENFKDAVKASRTQANKLVAYHRVWNALYQVQLEEQDREASARGLDPGLVLDNPRQPMPKKRVGLVKMARKARKKGGRK